MQQLEPLDRIIWSADEEDEPALIRKLTTMPNLRIVKIDRCFTLDTDLGVIDRITGLGFQVFDDAKIVEIPSKMEAIARKHVKHRPFMLNCMAGGMSTRLLYHDDRDKIDGLKRFAAVCNDAGVRSCGVTVLTSKQPATVLDEFNGRTNVEQVLYYVEWMLKCEFSDIVCSPDEAKAIRSDARFDGMDLNTPGIRLPGENAGDQARVDTPQGAVANGVTRLVIGRPITNGDSASNLQKFADALTAAAA